MRITIKLNKPDTCIGCPLLTPRPIVLKNGDAKCRAGYQVRWVPFKEKLIGPAERAVAVRLYTPQRPEQCIVENG